jgi:hypothetical protein
MVASELVRFFDRLHPPPSDSGGPFNVSTRELKGFGGHRIGKDSSGAPVLLLHVSEIGGKNPPNILLENISVLHDVPCRVWSGDQIQSDDRFTVIRCQGGTAQIRGYFLQVFEPVLNVVGANPTQFLVSEVIDQLVEMFRAISLPSRGSVQGLWGELFVIANCSDPAAAIDAWHGLPEDVFDFSTNECAVEVKSSVGTARKHEFSLEQLTRPQSQAFIASVLTQRAGGGTSIEDLATRIREKIAFYPHLLLRLDKLIWTTLGDAALMALEQRFSEPSAVDTLRFFAAEAIPRPQSIPPEVTGLRFTADLSRIEHLDTRAAASQGTLLRILAERIDSSRR